jgi:hypothetical protein
VQQGFYASGAIVLHLSILLLINISNIKCHFNLHFFKFSELGVVAAPLSFDVAKDRVHGILPEGSQKKPISNRKWVFYF